MSKSKIAVVLLLLCSSLLSLLPIVVSQVGIERGNGGGSGGDNVQPPTARPVQPTGRPVQPTARPSFTGVAPTRTGFTQTGITRTGFTSFTLPSTLTSRTFSPTFTLTTVTSRTFSPTFTMTTNGGYTSTVYGGINFVYLPPGYSYSVGSFTLSQTLYNQNNVPCLYYTYFEFNAYAGQTVAGRVWTSGSPLNYVIVPSNVIPALQSVGCNLMSRGQVQTFSSVQQVSWVASQSGEYAIIFYSTSPYSGQVYFQPGP
jgi:hypothetical protein